MNQDREKCSVTSNYIFHLFIWYRQINGISLKRTLWFVLCVCVFDSAQNAPKESSFQTYVYSTECSISVSNRKHTTGDSNAMRFVYCSSSHYVINIEHLPICSLTVYILCHSLYLPLIPFLNSTRWHRLYSTWLFDCALHALYLNRWANNRTFWQFVCVHFFFRFLLSFFILKPENFRTKTKRKQKWNTLCSKCATCKVADL